MHRRSFLSNSFRYTLGSGALLHHNWNYNKELVIGHSSHRYKVDVNWGALDSRYFPVNDCHEMVMDKKGRILLLTNHTKNNILIYNQDGRLLKSWGTEFPGAHGLTLSDEGGQEFLYICDNNRHELIKTSLDGKVVQILPWPKESGKYNAAEEYIPTESAIAPNGDIYIADGYGLQYILHYSVQGDLLNIFGGKGSEDHHFKNAHGICIDNRGEHPTLLITEREDNQLKRFSLDGQLIEIINLPGCYICRPVIHNQNIYLATIWSGDKSPGSGFISILNEDNQLISAPGGITPKYKNNELTPMRQALQLFQHPHDVCIDQDDNLYVAQWNSGKTYPIKLIRA